MTGGADKLKMYLALLVSFCRYLSKEIQASKFNHMQVKKRRRGNECWRRKIDSPLQVSSTQLSIRICFRESFAAFHANEHTYEKNFSNLISLHATTRILSLFLFSSNYKSGGKLALIFKAFLCQSMCDLKTIVEKGEMSVKVRTDDLYAKSHSEKIITNAHFVTTFAKSKKQPLVCF